jgi:hypothetical protein
VRNLSLGESPERFPRLLRRVSSRLSAAGIWLIVTGSLMALGACGTVLYNRPATNKADDWTITVTLLKDGPNSFPMGNGVNFVPADGDHLMYVTLTIRNDARAAREFSYDACDLDAGSQVVLPGLIDRDMAIHALADKVESFDPGQERGRRLIFSYPAGATPTRVKCGNSTFSLAP